MRYGKVFFKASNNRNCVHFLCECEVCHRRFRRSPCKIFSKVETPCSRECNRVLRSTGGIWCERRKQSSIVKFGSEWPCQSDVVKEKQAATNIERYGVVCSQLNEEVRSKTIATNMDKRGVPFSVMDSDVRRRSHETMLSRHGVEFFPLSESFKTSVDWIDVHRRRVETMKQNGTWNTFTSQPEQELFETLSDCFGEDNVERWVYKNGWNIDMVVHLESADVYVQLDGVFWHGQTLTDEELIAKGYDLILETKNKDVRQNAWFKSMDVPLLRITDLEWKDLKKRMKNDPDLLRLTLTEMVVKLAA